MRLVKSTTIFLLLLGFFTNVQAQSEYSDASIYSFFGVGLPLDLKSSQAAGMGLTGVAISSQIHGNLSNPALWGNTYFTMFNGGLRIENTNAEDIYSKAEYSSLGVTQFQIQLPIIREKLGASLSVSPVTEARFSLNQDSEHYRVTESGIDTLRYNVFTRGEGGLSRIELGFGYQLHRRVMVGYAGSIVFGVQDRIRENSFWQTGYAFSREVERTSYSGFANRFGLFADYPRVFGRNDYVAIGATINLPVDLNTKTGVKATIGNREIELVEEQKGTARLPIEYALGLTYYTNQYLMFSAEGKIQKWSEFENFSSFNEEFLSDRVKLGFGFEYAAVRRPEESIFTRFIYRGGVSLDSGHLELNNTRIETLTFSAGIGIPSPASGSSIDVNVDFGLRGTTSHELVREKIFAVRVAFNLSEMMFLQRRLQ